MKESPQVDKSHYNINKYSNPARWASYYYQLTEVLIKNPKEILEIGVGDKVFGSFIINNTSVSYKSVDIASDLNPNIVGSVTALPLEDNSFDAVCAFEVLEHLPFKSFERAVSEMIRVSKSRVYISLPHFGPPVKFMIKIPFLPEIKFAFKIPFAKKHVFNGQHYFEIGKKGFGLATIISVLKRHAKLKRHFVPFENQYHHFFILEK